MNKEQIKAKVKENLVEILSAEIAQDKAFNKLKEEVKNDMLKEFDLLEKPKKLEFPTFNERFADRMGFPYDPLKIKDSIKNAGQSRKSFNSMFENMNNGQITPAMFSHTAPHISKLPFFESTHMTDYNDNIISSELTEMNARVKDLLKNAKVEKISDILSGATILNGEECLTNTTIPIVPQIKETEKIKKSIFRSLERKDLKVNRNMITVSTDTTETYYVFPEKKTRSKFSVIISVNVSSLTRQNKVTSMLVSIGDNHYSEHDFKIGTIVQIFAKVQEMDRAVNGKDQEKIDEIKNKLENYEKESKKPQAAAK